MVILHLRAEKDCSPQVMIIYNKRSKRAGKQYLGLFFFFSSLSSLVIFMASSIEWEIIVVQSN